MRGDSANNFGAPSTAQNLAIVPPATATITSGMLILPGQPISGTASDTGGPGLAGIILYYKNLSSGAGGAVLTTCTGCGAGHTSTKWSYTPQPTGPLSPGRYTIVTEPVDSAYNFGTPSSSQTMSII